MRDESIKTVDDYIAKFDGEKKKRLLAMRKTIKKAAPKAEEKISWDMPTYAQNGNVVHFAAGARHTGFYPGAEGVEAFAATFDERGLKYSKGAVQLPDSAPLPLELVAEITEFRVKQNDQWAKEKAEQKAAPKAAAKATKAKK